MDDIERRLRAAMTEATEVAPPRLLANIYQRHRRLRQRRRLAAVGYAALAAAVAIAVPPIGQALRHHPPPGFPRNYVAPGTLLLTCNDSIWGQLQSNWRAVSLRAGPLWFFGAREEWGFVHSSAFRMHAHSSYRYRGLKGEYMIVEVANGATVVMKPVAAARSYFRFNDFNGTRTVRLPTGDTGFTFSACPRSDGGPNGPVTEYYLAGYAIKAGRTAKVDIWTGPSADSIQVIFTCPGCH